MDPKNSGVGKVVYVTGESGFIASWMVNLLLLFAISFTAVPLLFVFVLNFCLTNILCITMSLDPIQTTSAPKYSLSSTQSKNDN